MPSLKDLRNRIGSVKSTRKITSAMKMVAAAKLRRAQEAAQAAQPFADRMAGMLGRLAANTPPGPDTPRLLSGTGKDDTYLLVVISADRGLCGGFNGYLGREAKRRIDALLAEGKDVQVVTVGRKARDFLKRFHVSRIVESFEEIDKPKLDFAAAEMLAISILDRFEADAFDVCEVIYNRFVSVVSQKPTRQQLIPFAAPLAEEGVEDGTAATAEGPPALYEFEPDQEQILEALLPRNLATQLFRALLDSSAGEQAARMTAMDNATRNAGDMINRLTLTYNRERQAYITKELIEIISGAEAL